MIQARSRATFFPLAFLRVTTAQIKMNKHGQMVTFLKTV